jgi:hypothetical protein
MEIISPKPPSPLFRRKRTGITPVQTVIDAAVGNMITNHATQSTLIVIKTPPYHSMYLLKAKHGCPMRGGDRS